MQQNKDIPKGHKLSLLGVIPEEWEVKKLGDLVEISSGESPSLFNLSSKGRYPYLKVEDLNNSNKYQNISRDYSNDEKSLIQANSIIFPKRGAAIMNNKVRINKVVVQMDSNLMAITPINNNIYFEYLYYKIIHEQLFRIADTSTIPQINNRHIFPYKFSLPPLREQEHIAEILSTWDEAIEKQNKIVEKLELRKCALIQQLLTGKKRLGGFSDKWKTIYIRDVAKETSLKNKSNKLLTVLSCTKYNGLVPSLEYFGRKIFSDNLHTYKIVPIKHFAYATNHIEEGSIGYQDQYQEALISPMYTVFRTNSSINDFYFFKLLKSHWLIHQYNARMEGSIDRRGGLRWDLFSSIKIFIPEIKEQKAIANILTAADNEISLAKSKLDSLNKQKKGLMQVLLTGKIRVKI